MSHSTEWHLPVISTVIRTAQVGWLILGAIDSITAHDA